VGEEATFDVIASADTLIYFGALNAFARAAYGALRPGGWLGFTVERNESGDDFRINPHGRYSHNEGYLRNVLLAAGFTTLTIVPAVLRTELGQPAQGWVVRAQVA
jgi:predicted TPR repeat methyltransferase